MTTENRDHISRHPLQVLSYAAKHDHVAAMDEAVAHTLALPMSKVLDALSGRTLVAWVCSNCMH
jgi:hypothetical protein